MIYISPQIEATGFCGEIVDDDAGFGCSRVHPRTSSTPQESEPDIASGLASPHLPSALSDDTGLIEEQSTILHA